MKLKPIDLGSQSNVGRYPHAGVAQLINCHVEEAGKEGRVQWPIYADSGRLHFSSLGGTGGVQRMLATDDTLYVVAGRVMSKVDQSGVATILGGIPSDGLVTMARNTRTAGPQIGIVRDGLYFVIDNNVMTQINDPDLSSPNSIAFLGGYMMFTSSLPSGKFMWGNLDDATAVDGLAFAYARTNPDPLLIGKARGRDLLLFGNRSIEVWYLNDGSGDAPVSFRSAMSVGAYCAGGVIDTLDTVFFLAATANGFAGVRVMNGDVPSEIGNPYVNRVMAAEANPSTITGTVRNEFGRTFLEWSGTNWTLIYDLKTQQWHDGSHALGRSRVSQYAQLGSQLIAGDATSPVLYTQSPTYYDDDGDPLIVTVRTPPVHAAPNRIEINAVYLDVVPGVGAGQGNAQDISPTVSMRYSINGKEWSTELRRSIGAQGQDIQRVVWTRIGTAPVNGFTFEFSASAKVARGLMGAAVEYTVLPP